MPQETNVAIKVWDLPVRLFHWVLVVLFAFQLFSGWVGVTWMTWHAYSGYAILVLVFFRILWGFAGSTHARFASFIAGPGATLRFARRLFSREAVPQAGHNPLGGWMVIVMVVSLALQAITGLFSNDGISFEGPLAAQVTIDISNDFAVVHRWNLRFLLVLSAIHIAAVLFHLIFKKDNVTAAMFTGVKYVPESFLRERREALRGSPTRRAASRENASTFFAGNWRALGLLVVAMVLVYLLVYRSGQGM